MCLLVHLYIVYGGLCYMLLYMNYFSLCLHTLYECILFAKMYFSPDEQIFKCMNLSSIAEKFTGMKKTCLLFINFAAVTCGSV